MVETIGGLGLFIRDENQGGMEEYRGWTFACVRAIAEKVSSIELQLKKKNGDDVEIVRNHPVIELLNDINPFMTLPDVVTNTQSFLELEGSSFWWVSKVGNKPVSVWPLRPDLVSVVPDAETYIKEYRYKIGNKTFTLNAEDIVPFKEFNPKDPYKGLGTTYAAASSINADNYARDWQKAFFKNGARIDGVLMKDGTIDEEEYRALNNRWNDKYKGVEKAHKIAVLDNGLKYQPVGATAADMDFVNLRTMSRDEILAMFRVPKTILGVTDGTATRATAETSEYVFMKETIKPKMQKFVRTLNEYLLPMFGLDTSVYFIDFTDPVPQNRELDLLTYQNALANGWMSINEVRAHNGLAPVENGDAPRVAFGTEPLGAPIEVPKAIDDSKPQGKTDAASVAKEITAAILPALKAAADMEEFETRGEKAQNSQVKRGNSYEKKLEKIMTEFFDGQKERVLSAFDDTYKKNVHMNKAAADDLLDEDDEAAALIKSTQKFFNVVVQAEGDEALVLAGLEAAFDARSERVQAALKRELQKFAGSVTEETSKQIREAIGQGLDEGEALNDIRKRVQELSAFDKARSQVIARTETTRAQNFASVTAWGESGLVESKILYTALDERVDDICADLHGQEFALDENVDPGNDYGKVDGPPIHPNCRCTLLPVVTKKSVVAAELKEADLLKDMAELEAVEKELDLDV